MALGYRFVFVYGPPAQEKVATDGT
jgi:hypothetical protein